MQSMTRQGIIQVPSNIFISSRPMSKFLSEHEAEQVKNLGKISMR